MREKNGPSKKMLVTEVKITYSEYKKMHKYFNYKLKKRLIIISLLIIFVMMFGLFPPDPLPIWGVIEVDIILISLVYIVLKLFDLLFRKFNYKKIFKKDRDNVYYALCFYDDHIEKRAKNSAKNIFFSDIKKIKEIDKHFYIVVDKENVIPIDMNKCSSDLILFIRSLQINNLKKRNDYLNDLNNYMVPIEQDNKGMQIFLKILFVICLLIVPIGVMLSLPIACKNIPSYVIDYFPTMDLRLIFFKITLSSILISSYLWSCLILLPIPIISFILGIIYRERQIKCTKNIVIGVIASILLLIIGSYSFSFNFEKDYSEVHSLDKIVDINFPKEGRVFVVDYQKIDDSDDVSTFILFKNRKEANKFYEQIQNDSRWIYKDDVSDELEQFVQSTCADDEICYFSIYIDDIDEYNTFPENTGDYHVYSMMYNATNKYLAVEYYTTSYEIIDESGVI